MNMNCYCFCFCILLFYTTLSFVQAQAEPPKECTTILNIDDLDAEVEHGNTPTTQTPATENKSHETEIHSSIINVEGEPSALVNRCVNVITGDYSDLQVDLVVPGPQPIMIQRAYSSAADNAGNCLFSHGWNLNHEGQMTLTERLNAPVQEGEPPAPKDPPEYDATTKEGYGVRLSYDGTLKKGLDLRSEITFKRLTNCGSGEISGRTNLLNTRIYKEDKNTMYISLGSGIKRLLDRKEHGETKFILTQENHPCGNQFTYKYDANDRLKKITSRNAAGDPLSYVLLDRYSTEEDSEEISRVVELTSSQGKSVKYSFMRLKGRLYLSDVERPNAPSEHYEYDRYESRLERFGKKYTFHRLVSKSRPNGPIIQEIEYYDVGGDYKVANKTFNVRTKDVGRVKCLKAPVGTNGKPVVTHSFIYHDDDNETDVYDAFNHKTTYTFDGRRRLTSVKKMSKLHLSFEEGLQYSKAYSEDQLFWSVRGNLKYRVFSGEDKCYFVRHFEYDEQHNVVEEQLYGNLTGRYTKSIDFVDGDIVSKKKVESYAKKRDYDPQFNLMTHEDDGRKIITLKYYPDTDLLMHRFVKDNGKICQRQFFEYDANAVLTKEIRDDGTTKDKLDLTGVTERHIKTIQPSQNPVGLPEVIEERYLDLKSGKECLLSKVINEYSECGNLQHQHHYDSNGNLAYTLHWEHNSMGNITLESNALGEITKKDYDLNGNQNFEKKLGTDYHKEMSYDFANRLMRVEDIFDNGLRLVVCYEYNELNQKIASFDIYGNRTKYSYDQYNRLYAIRYPEVPDQNGKMVKAGEKIKYDPMNHPVSRIDALGHETKSEFTIRGKPYRIEYPDGSVESSEYTLDGLLESSTAKNGVVTHYQYDYLGRLTCKEIKSPSGELLSTTFATYSAFHMLSETDAAGNILTYDYDAAGRLIRLKKQESRVEFQYDTLGRVSRTLEYFGPNEQDCVVKAQEYDLLNRVIEERTEDANGTLLKKMEYGYDIEGNRTEIRSSNQAGLGITKTVYNSYHEPILVTDAHGNETKTIIHYNHQNTSGQTVAYKETIDSLGNVSIVIHDTRGRIASTLRKNSLGQITQERHFFYDACGNRTRLEEIPIGNARNKKVVATYEYDSLNRLCNQMEAVGSDEQKQTRTKYNLYGQKETITKPDGVCLHHEYDLLGRLALFRASDNSFQYRYTYDKNSNPTIVNDEINHCTTLRKYDHHNRMTEETLGNGLITRYRFDSMGRPLVVTFPDQSGVGYQYSGCYLKAVQRLSKEGKVVYTHHYNKYDLVGNVVSDTLIANLGVIDYEFDLMGRPKKISSKHWKELVPSHGFDKVGNLLQYTIKDALGTVENKFSYDDLYQLTSEQGVSSHQYAFDSLYNRIQKDALLHTVNQLNQLTSDSKTTYSYDLNGNLKQKTPENVRYDYDALDRLISVTKDNHQTRYTYDSFNRRLSKTSLQQDHLTKTWHEKNRVRYFYQQGQNEVGACNAKGEVIELRILGSGKGAEIGAAIAIELNEELFAPIHDHNGNVMSLVSTQTQHVEETYRYSAFGEEFIFDESGKAKKTSCNPWRFSSKRVDEESNLVYFGRRYYDPGMGRWLTPDPLGESAGPNLYAYVNNSPLTHFDAYGLWSEAPYARPDEGTKFNASYNHAPSWTETAARSVLDVAASVFSFVSDLFPVPIIGDMFALTGHILDGKSVRSYVPYSKRPSAGHYYIPGQEIPNRAIMITHGINNTYQDIASLALEISMRLGGVRVDFVFHGHYGLFGDGFACLCQKLKIPTPSSKLVLKATKDLLERVGLEGKFFLGGHSQGGEILNYNRPYFNPQERDRMYVYTFGSPSIIPKDAFKRVKPNIDNNDGVTYLSPIRNICYRYSSDSHVSYTTSAGLPFSSHSFRVTYKEPLNDMIKDFKNSYFGSTP